MIVYKCFITGDEMFSDSLPIKDIHEALYEIEGKFITEKAGDVDDSLIGGNKSAEEPDESQATEGASTSGPNVALINRYVETGFGTKKEFLLTMKAYIKAALAFQKAKALEDKKEFDEDAFKAAHTDALMKFIAPKYDDLQFFTGESMNPEGTIPLLLWKTKEGSEAETPFFYYFKSGLKVEKY